MGPLLVENCDGDGQAGVDFLLSVPPQPPPLPEVEYRPDPAAQADERQGQMEPRPDRDIFHVPRHNTVMDPCASVDWWWGPLALAFGWTLALVTDQIGRAHV